MIRKGQACWSAAGAKVGLLQRCPLTGYPHLFRFKLELASAPRWKGDCILLLILVRSFLALKKQNGLEPAATS
jgi:hypothetical protein